MTKKTLSEADSELFRKAIGPVKTIKKDKLLLKPDEKPRPYPKQQLKEAINPLENADVSAETVMQGDRIDYLAPGLQKNVLRKLRKGYFGLDAHIDLHGLTSQEAKRQFIRFIQDCQENGCRCVHIIHGKGYRSPNNQPVLKNDLNLWLRQHKDVLAFCSSPPRAGGTGAVFVLLRLAEKYSDFEDEEYEEY